VVRRIEEWHSRQRHGGRSARHIDHRAGDVHDGTGHVDDAGIEFELEFRHGDSHAGTDARDVTADTGDPTARSAHDDAADIAATDDHPHDRRKRRVWLLGKDGPSGRGPSSA
jgi:hypothetical protein